MNITSPRTPYTRLHERLLRLAICCLAPILGLQRLPQHIVPKQCADLARLRVS